MALTIQQIRHLAFFHGLGVVAISTLTPPKQAEQALIRWQRAGMAAEMAFMRRDAALWQNVISSVPGAKSYLVVSVLYSRAALGPRPPGTGRVARYAWGRDYHVILKRRLEAFCEELKSMQPELVYRVFSDAVPLLERGYAAQAGLGFIGKNTMLIRPKAGSFSFLGEILWNLEVEAEPAPVDVTNCGACERCITRCPSHAFSEPFVLDARRCVSYLTIEKRGAFTEGESQAIGEWLFGCDLCQEICPFNHRALKEGLASDLPEFDAHAGTGPWLNLASVLKLRSDAEFKARFRGTALLRAKREGLLRNAAVVAANTKSYELIPVLDKVAKEDPSPLVRDHAHWALRHLA